MRRAVGLFLLGLVVVVGGSPSVFADRNSAALNGIDAFEVIVERLEDRERGDDLSQNRLRTDIVLRLRSHGFRPKQDAVGSSLYFNVTAMTIDHAGPNSHYLWSIECVYRQGLTLANGAAIMPAVWGGSLDGSIGLVSAQGYTDKIRGLARDCADDFAAAFMEANPDFTPPRPSD